MSISHKLKINAKPSTIFNALKTEEGIKGWWCNRTKAEDSVGGVIEMEFDKEGTIVPMHMKVEQLNENQKVVWSCFHNGNPAWINTNLTFEINEVDGGSQLVFNHDNWEQKWIDSEPYKMTEGGWGHFINSLKEYCETGAGQPW